MNSIPAHTESPSTLPKRPKRTPKKKSSHAQGLPAKPPAPVHPIQILRKQDEGALPAKPPAPTYQYPIQTAPQEDCDTRSDCNGFLTTQSPHQTTLSHPIPKYDGAGEYTHDSPSDANRRRKSKAKTQNEVHPNALGKSMSNYTPSSTPRPGTLTPGRSSGTPSKAYAGPTFHASPAASSLPLPRFMSRSNPNVDKTTSLNKMLEQDGLDGTSESDGSPVFEDSQPFKDRRAREESPLDIFFQADRDAKAKELSSMGESPFHHEKRPNGVSRLGDTISSFQSPARNHSRHHTGNSTGGMFPLEMDGALQEPSHSDTPASTRSSAAAENGRPPSAPESLTGEQIGEEQRIAQTLALKKLLHSPRPQLSASSSSPSPLPKPRIPSSDFGSPVPKPVQKNRTPARNTSGPPAFSLLSGSPGQDQRQAALLALAEKQIANTNGISSHRPSSSSLCQEMPFLEPAGSSAPAEPPMTPTPSRHVDSRPHVLGSNQGNAPPNAQNPLLYSLFSPQSLPAKESGSDPAKVKSIENDLRRILKLDPHDGTGVAGVQIQ